MSNVILFGDQTAEQYPLLHRIVLRKDNAPLANFVERIALAIREETRTLPRSQRDAIPDFLTLNNLIEAYYQKGVKLPMIESALLTAT